MELKDKINELTNRFAVTEEELMEALLLERPFVVDADLYLSFQAVMISKTGQSPKIILNFLHNVLNRVDIGKGGFECTMYRIFHTLKSFNKEEEGFEYLAEVFGRYDTVRGAILLRNIRLIEEYKYKIG